MLRVSGRFLLASKRMKASDSKMITAVEAACVLFNFFCICVRRQHFRLIKISSWFIFLQPIRGEFTRVYLAWSRQQYYELQKPVGLQSVFSL